ncbi:MAG: hypothetical protein FH756_06005 [Firmicutes bacterium]|nr:hypothetical protein [Bacillota bacterium]
MQELIREYKKSLRLLRTAKAVPMGYSSMVSDTQWAIGIMETGRIPGTKWNVSRWAKEKREVSVDPLEMSKYVSNRAPVDSAPKWMVELLEVLMSNLTDRERQAFQLVRGQCYSFSQAAELMGCKKGSVQLFVRRAEKKINLVLRKQTINEGVI